MSAYQAYAGAYEFEGESFTWRCYATTRVHALRRQEHGPFPKPPAGRKWLRHTPLAHEPEVGWLVDETVQDFSHMLLQVASEPVQRPARSDRFAAAV